MRKSFYCDSVQVSNWSMRQRNILSLLHMIDSLNATKTNQIKSETIETKSKIRLNFRFN